MEGFDVKEQYEAFERYSEFEQTLLMKEREKDRKHECYMDCMNDAWDLKNESVCAAVCGL